MRAAKTYRGLAVELAIWWHAGCSHPVSVIWVGLECMDLFHSQFDFAV